MKNTQKKLKAKHFRYLNKEYVQDPDRFLREVVHQWGLNWSNNFNLLINSSLYPPMRPDDVFDYGFIYSHMGQMIEAAFIIFKKCNLAPLPQQQLFQHSSKVAFNADVADNEIFPDRILQTFFGFKSLKGWLSLLDDLLLHSDYSVSNMDQIQLPLEYIPIRELLTKLPKALHEIYLRGGLQYALPNKPDRP